MSFGVCLHFEEYDRDVWSGRQIDLDAWRYALKAFGGDRLAVVDLVPGGSGAKVMDESITVEWYTSLDEFEQVHDGESLVYVENDSSATPLENFDHPLDGWYVFGSSGGLDITGRDAVIVTQANQNVVMHPVHVAPVVLWDRWRKES